MMNKNVSSVTWLVYPALATVIFAAFEALVAKNGIILISRVLWFIIGLSLISLLGTRTGAKRVYANSFAASSLITALVCFAAQMVFEVSQTTTDAVEVFYPLATENTRESINEIAINAPLAVWMSRLVYQILRFVGVSLEPNFGIHINGCLVAMASGLTFEMASTVAGANRRGERVAYLILSYGGMFWIASSIFLRDAWSIYSSVLLLYGVWKCERKEKLGGSILIVASIAIHYYIRVQGAVLSIPLLALYPISVVLTRGRGRVAWQILAVSVIPIAIAVVARTTLTYWIDMANTYADFLRDESLGVGSLAAKFVLNQPIYIRLFTGIIYLLVFPVPIWTYWDLQMGEYFWLKSASSLTIILILPFCLAGGWQIWSFVRRGYRQSAFGMFCMLYFISGSVGVVMSTMETRHYLPYIPGLLVLTGAYSAESEVTRSLFVKHCIAWFVGVVAIQIAWMYLKLP